MSLDARTDTVDGVLRRSAAKFPDRRALTFEDRTWTYRELDDAVSRAAAYLQSLGLSAGERVAAYGTNSDAYTIGFLACARAGLVHVPVNYALKGDELTYLVSQSGSAAVLVDPALRGTLDSVRGALDLRHVIPLRDAEDSLLAHSGSGDVPVLAVPVAATDLAQLLYTSGTTS